MESELRIRCQQPSCTWRATTNDCQEAATQLVQHHVATHVRITGRPDDYAIHSALQVLGSIPPTDPQSHMIEPVVVWLKNLIRGTRAG
jgi:hypothetical protein